MKTKIMLAITAIMVLGLAVVVFAFTRSSGTSAPAMTTMSCCCSGDSCPMKTKDGAGKEAASCCEKCDGCKGDSCPMKAKKKEGDTSAGPAAETKDDQAHPKGCDCSCCNKDKEMKDMPAV